MSLSDSNKQCGGTQSFRASEWHFWLKCPSRYELRFLFAGDSAMLCRMIGALQGISIFVSCRAFDHDFASRALIIIEFQVSTISITAIALDRYQVQRQFQLKFHQIWRVLFKKVIVGCPAKDNLQMLGAFLILLLIWVIAFVCAAPLYIYRHLSSYRINMTTLDFKVTLWYCEERWPELPLFDGRVYYR